MKLTNRNNYSIISPKKDSRKSHFNFLFKTLLIFFFINSTIASQFKTQSNLKKATIATVLNTLTQKKVPLEGYFDKTFAQMDKNSIGKKAQSWMSLIKDDTKINAITIPGTHDSGTINMNKICCACQSLNFEQQLELGIRYFDIRFEADESNKSKAYIFHYYLNKKENQDIETVFGYLKAFLTKNPTEGVIAKLILPKGFQETLLKYSDILLLKKEIPTMKELRGKVWLLLKEAGAFDNLATLEYKDSNFTIQKEFKENDPEKKFSFIQKHVNNISNGGLANLSINQTSAAPIDSLKTELLKKSAITYTPSEMAQKINAKLFGLKGFLGVTVMDFPSAMIIEYIYSQNKEVSSDKSNLTYDFSSKLKKLK